MNIWVSEDGSFGSSVVEVFDASDWTEDQLDELAEARDDERLATARRFKYADSVGG